MLYCRFKTQITNSTHQHVSEWDEVNIVASCSLDVSSVDRLDDHNALQVGRSFRSESNELLGERQRTANNDGDLRCKQKKITSLINNWHSKSSCYPIWQAVPCNEKQNAVIKTLLHNIRISLEDMLTAAFTRSELYMIEGNCWTYFYYVGPTYSISATCLRWYL